jgi:hypothetical protein
MVWQVQQHDSTLCFDLRVSHWVSASQNFFGQDIVIDGLMNGWHLAWRSAFSFGLRLGRGICNLCDQRLGIARALYYRTDVKFRSIKMYMELHSRLFHNHWFSTVAL